MWYIMGKLKVYWLDMADTVKCETWLLRWNPCQWLMRQQCQCCVDSSVVLCNHVIGWTSCDTFNINQRSSKIAMTVVSGLQMIFHACVLNLPHDTRCWLRKNDITRVRLGYVSVWEAYSAPGDVLCECSWFLVRTRMLGKLELGLEWGEGMYPSPRTPIFSQYVPSIPTCFCKSSYFHMLAYTTRCSEGVWLNGKWQGYWECIVCTVWEKYDLVCKQIDWWEYG